jgi:transcriptional antiterminator RfaH
MPFLDKETDLFPDGLLSSAYAEENPWWAMYTLARQEKKLMRMLIELELPFYGPVIKRRYRSAGGRMRTSYEPLFTNYVFVCGDDTVRYTAVTTGCVSRWMPVGQPLDLVHDLRQVHQLICTDAPLSPERRLEPGQRVRIRTGPFKGYEGVVFRRQQETRLQVSVRFMDQGVSVAIEDCQVDAI